MRRCINGRAAIHDGDRVWRGRHKKTVAGELPRPAHLVVGVHPGTGHRVTVAGTKP